MKTPAIIVCGGGHARVLLDTLRQLDWVVQGYADRNETALSSKGIAYLGPDAAIEKLDPTQVILVNGLGSVKSTEARKAIFERYRQLGFRFATLVHPSAIVARDCVVHEGAQILAGSIVQPDCEIGENSILNTGCRIDHDGRIGRHVHIAPGVTLSGAVHVGEGTHVGTGAVVIQGINIGRHAVVGAGAVVTRDVKDHVVVVGVPARDISTKNSNAHET